MGFAIKCLNPTRVIIVFDGKGGSQKRRKLYPEYKGKRKVSVRYNRNIHVSSKEDEDQSMKMQINRLLQYLECLPVSVILIDNIEADDTIAYIAKNPLDSEQNNYYIMSTDKDFYQLIDDRIKVWSPTKKKLYDEVAIFDEFGIHSNNFVMYRILDGDVSDNIGGVNGWGLKTIQKKLPLLSGNGEVDVDELVNFCKDKEGKLFESVVSSKDILDRNYKLMQLKDVDISGDAKMRIVNGLRKEIQSIIKWKFQTMILEDKLNAAIPNLDFWMKTCFDALNSYAITYNKGINVE